MCVCVLPLWCMCVCDGVCMCDRCVCLSVVYVPLFPSVCVCVMGVCVCIVSGTYVCML